MTQQSLGFRRATPDEIAGSIRLAVARNGGRSHPVKTGASGIFRLMRPLYLDDSGQVTYIIVSYGGAYFGETYRIAVDVQPAANLLLTSQGATRIYKTPRRPAIQDITFNLKAGSRLEYVPDQTIAYKNADYRQSLQIVATPDAQGFFAEDVTPGWDPEGSRFTYSNMHMRIDVRSEETGGLVCADNVQIRPDTIGAAINGVGYFEGASHMGSILILGQHTGGDYPDRVRDVIDGCRPARTGVTNGTRHGISWLMVRSLAESTDILNEITLAVNELDRSVTTGQTRINLRRY